MTTSYGTKHGPILIARALVLLVVLAPLPLRPIAAQRVKVGQRAPDIALAVLDSGPAKVRLAQLKGHPVVISFWASWCPPCRKFGTVALPLYAIVDSNGRTLKTFAGLTRSPAEFLTFLGTVPQENGLSVTGE